ncbi:hypothetical protein J7L68_00920 [bacterium]|nr:hypothetical protein [bacterium]
MNDNLVVRKVAQREQAKPAKAIVDIMNGLQLLHVERGKPLVEIMESAMKIAKILINGLKK